MSIFQKVTLATLKKNKVRTAVTIIGVLLATAMICAVTTIASSTINYTKENYEYMDGSWHGSVWDADAQTLDKIRDSDKVDEVVYGQSIGYADVDSTDPDKPYLYILGASQGFADMMPVHLTAGKYPGSTSEILLPEHLLMSGDVTYKLGDRLSLSEKRAPTRSWAFTAAPPLRIRTLPAIPPLRWRTRGRALPPATSISP